MRRALPVIVAGAAVAASSVVTAAPASAYQRMPIPLPEVRTIVEGLPPFSKGLAVAPDGSVVVGDSSGTITRHVVTRRGSTATVVTRLEEPIVDLAVGKDRGWILTEGGDVWVWRLGQDAPRQVANIVAYQQTDPDPNNIEGEPTESNPFAIEAHPDGSALVADAAGNDLLKVRTSGKVSTMARFPVERVRTDHLPEEFGEFPPKLPAESVPTTVAVGPDGAVYVGELKGFPFRPGSARIWTVRANASEADCSLTAHRGACYTAEKGYTSIADLDVHPTGVKVVLEYAKGGTLAFEGGFETGEFPPAVLKASYLGRRVELLKGTFSQPGGVAVGRGGVYVLDGLVTGGRLSKIL